MLTNITPTLIAAAAVVAGMATACLAPTAWGIVSAVLGAIVGAFVGCCAVARVSRDNGDEELATAFAITLILGAASIYIATVSATAVMAWLIGLLAGA